MTRAQGTTDVWDNGLQEKSLATLKGKIDDYLFRLRTKGA